jgi:hypothetical protein
VKRVLAAAALAVVLVPSVIALTSERASAGETGRKARRMLVISLPAVSWQDVNDRELPNLNRFLDTAAVADLTTRSVNRETRLGEGYITLGAGTRAVGVSSFNESDGNAFEVGEAYGTDTAGEVYTRRTGREAGNGLVDLDIGDILDRNKQELFDAEIGALGNALSDADWSRAVIANGDGLDVENLPGGYYRRQAVTALMGPEGRVQAGAVGPDLLAPDPEAPFGLRYDNEAVLGAFRDVWDDQSVVLVEGSDLVRADAYRTFATPLQRDRLFDQALRRTDELVGVLLREVDFERDAVMVVGPSPPLREVRLTIAALRAPGIEPGLLHTGTTRRSGFVQLIDVAPTILERVGIEVPDSMEGRAAEVGRGGGSASDRRAFLENSDTAAQFRDERIPTIVIVFVCAQVLLVIGTLLWLARPDRPHVPAILRTAALAALGFIAAVLLARTVPFHDIGDLAYWTWLAVVAFVLAALYQLARGRDVFLPLMLALGVIVALLLFDALVGTPLQFNNPFGYSPRVAGRFSGYGNLAYAALASSAVLLSGLLAHRVGGRRGALIAIGLLGVVFVVDGVPFWGADVGGVLSILPAYAVTAYLLLGVRVRLRTAMLCIATAVVAVLAFGAFDLTRPSDERTHLGRLFETTESRGWSGLSTVIRRKISENLEVLFTSEWLIIVLLVLVFLAYLYARHRERLREIVQRAPEMRAAFIGFAILAVLGFALNDSGIAIPGMMLSVLNATIIVLFVTVKRADAAQTDEVPAVDERAPVGTRG